MQNQSGFIVDISDNVATALSALTPGDVKLFGEVGDTKVNALGEIPFGHKFALCDIPKGSPIIKYAARIGTATADIPKGSHVHLHNMKSDFDDRSNTLDVVTAAPKDVLYELY